jgi:hypothetical protein
VAEAKVVVSAELFHSTVSPETKLVPVTVRVNPEPPAVALAGASELTVGAGAAMAKLTELEVAPPGACTLTAAEPEVAMSVEDTAAVS